MNQKESRLYLLKIFKFSEEKLKKLDLYVDLVLRFNKSYNLISRTTESLIWSRHILDSAQLIKFIDFSASKSLSDLGTGAGFPGIVLAICNDNSDFHVKLYEKSPVKCGFLEDAIKILSIKAEIYRGDFRTYQIDSEYIVSRAFKKLDEIINISREIAKKPHKMIILKGKSAQDEINKASKDMIFKYKLENSITDRDSKIIIMDVK